MRTKFIFRLLAIILWCFVIFAFSDQPGSKSVKQSDALIETTVDVVTNNSVKEEKKVVIVKNWSYKVRKIAHFTEYLILAVLVARFIVLFNTKKYVIFTLLLCFLFALCDEYHQTFVDSRSGKFSDALIDTSGSAFGLSIYIFASKRKRL